MTANGLLGSTTLEVAIGLIFVYLLLAVICTTMNEWIAGILKTRSTTLKSAIKQLLDNQAGAPNPADSNWFLKQFYAHPLITGMNQPGKTDSHPAYISARTFATAVMDITTPQQCGVLTFADLECGIRNLPPGDVRKTLMSLIQNCSHDVCQAQQNIEAWYNDTMDRVSGWYKRRTQVWTVVLALMLTLCANADTLQIARTLWTDPTLRAELVEKAKQRVGSDDRWSDGRDKDSLHGPNPAPSDDLDVLGLVVGWNHQSLPVGYRGWTDKVFGFLLSIVAISLGAPFWFDLLNKFMRIRNGGDSPTELRKTN